MPADRSGQGQHLDTDIRFMLANERTLLAWLRTALSLEAAGFALITLAHITGGRVVGIGLVALGSISALIGYRRYRSSDRAIRRGVLPVPGRGPALLTMGIVGLSVLLLVLAVI
ncbi:MAG: hypothetical protein DLM59_09795 [Pseudonocardiales bacterium]|nr:MAG: hypothetical protein DLM59_09795 [Pseudonocardiales bacterium]